jgi:hypothetical protein
VPGQVGCSRAHQPPRCLCTRTAALNCHRQVPASRWGQRHFAGALALVQVSGSRARSPPHCFVEMIRRPVRRPARRLTVVRLFAQAFAAQVRNNVARLFVCISAALCSQADTLTDGASRSRSPLFFVLAVGCMPGLVWTTCVHTRSCVRRKVTNALHFAASSPSSSLSLSTSFLILSRRCSAAAS